MKKEFRQNLGAIFSGAAAGGAFLTMLFGLNWPFLIDLPIAAGIYAGLYMITKPKRSIGGLDIDFIENGDELERKLAEAKEDYDNIISSIGKIINPEVRNEACKLSETSEAIIKYLESNPPKIRQARQFIDYYQDSASKLLQKYIDLENSNIETEAICKLKNDTRSALVTLNEAFCGQFEKLMRGELTDMQAELELLEKTVKMEMGK